MRLRPVAMSIGALLVPCVALAHPGHNGGFAGGLLHPLTGLDHLLAMVAVGMLAAEVKEKRGVWMLPAAFVTALIMGGLLGIMRVSIPYTEAIIALSVLTLGVLVALRVSLPFSIGVATVTGFGLFHGIAHGLEAGPHPYAFLAGMVITTAVLHFSGVLFVKKANGKVGNVLVRLAGSAMAIAGIVFLAG